MATFQSDNQGEAFSYTFVDKIIQKPKDYCNKYLWFYRKRFDAVHFVFQLAAPCVINVINSTLHLN